jgi:hypothetical protein
MFLILISAISESNFMSSEVISENNLKCGVMSASNLMKSEAISESNLMLCAIVKITGIILLK